MLKGQIILTMYHLEMFPPLLFTIMLYVLPHLVDEDKFKGLIRYRWTYWIKKVLPFLDFNVLDISVLLKGRKIQTTH